MDFETELGGWCPPSYEVGGPSLVPPPLIVWTDNGMGLLAGNYDHQLLDDIGVEKGGH